MSPPVQTITSTANPLLRDIKRAVARGELTGDGLWVAEGFNLLEEAVRSDCEVRSVIAAESVHATLRTPPSARTIVLPDALFQSIAATETSQGIMALVRPPTWSLEDIFQAQSMVVILDGLQDPGNAGAIVRSAEASVPQA